MSGTAAPLTSTAVPRVARRDREWWLASEGVASAALTFILCTSRIVFPVDDRASAEFSVLYRSAAREVVILTPAILVGISTMAVVSMSARWSPAGGHPLLALAGWGRGLLSLRQLIGVLAVQTMGAVAGGFLARGMLFEDLVLREGGILHTSPSLNLGSLAILEMLFAFFFGWVAYAGLACREPAEVSGELVRRASLLGGTVAAIMLAGRYFSGGVIHPTAAIGAFAATQIPIDPVTYLAAPVVGAITAGLVLRTLAPRNE